MHLLLLMNRNYVHVNPTSMQLTLLASLHLVMLRDSFSWPTGRHWPLHAQNPPRVQMKAININGLSQQRASIAYFNEAMDGFVKVTGRGEAAARRLKN